MAWIESHTVLLRHRKVIQMALALSLPPVVIVGHLHALWHTVLEQQEDGDLSSWPDEMIAQAAAYSGDPNVFVRAMQTQKFLDGKVIHDWLEYAGRYLTNKYRTSNPKKLKAIYKLHRSVSRTDLSQTKVCSKPDNQPDLTRPNQPHLQNRRIAREISAISTGVSLVTSGKTVGTWEAYRKAYESRYHAPPVRNAKVNGTLSRLVDRLGADAAPQVATFYLTLDDPFYVRVQHSTEILLRDCEGLHTQWITGRRPNHHQPKSMVDLL